MDMEFKKLCSIISDVLGVDVGDISVDTTFVDDLGADSLDVAQIIMGIEEEFDVTVDTDVASNVTTVGQALDLSVAMTPATARSGVVWKSSNKRVAVVDKNGRVTARKPGKGVDGLLEKGYRVPEDYSLCGFDNVFPSGFHRMELTTVDHSTQDHGASAFHLLRGRMEERSEKQAEYPITRLEYRSRLIVRGSTAAPRKGARDGSV